VSSGLEAGMQVVVEGSPTSDWDVVAARPFTEGE
jgi:hypothetical protein